MTERIAMASPRRVSGIAGALFLLTILSGIFAEMFVSDRLVVSGDAAATASNILAHRGLFQLGFAVYLIEMACQISTVALFYYLLRPVSRSLAVLAAFLELAGCVIKTFSRLFYIAPLLVLGGASYLSVFSPAQLQALALLSLKLNDRGAAMALVFFGFSGLVSGYLIFRSTFLPRILGVLGMLGGVGWLTFLYPPFAYRVFPLILAFGLIASVVEIFWLLVFGVNEQRWKEQASR